MDTILKWLGWCSMFGGVVAIIYFEWQIALFIFAGGTICFLVEREIERGKEDRTKKAEAYPSIEIGGNGFFHVQKFAYYSSPQPISCLCVHLTNTAQESLESCIARHVTATIDYYRAETMEHLFQIQGRWTDNLQPSDLPEKQPLHSLDDVDFKLGQSHQLDIAFKNAKDAECYAVDNHNWFFNRMKNPARELGIGRFLAKVRIRGTPKVDRTWTFEFENEGAAHYLKPTKLPYR